ncbi:hypothetical protein ACIPWY_03315 [Streptomyces sp. NPDC090032]|uniref:hypothetical protein n=1 Tax=Streptomyces sp. NPDC090032 TaxID=3365925 RepID=UPI0037F6081F
MSVSLVGVRVTRSGACETTAVAVDLLHCSYDVSEFGRIVEEHAGSGCLSEEDQGCPRGTGLGGGGGSGRGVVRAGGVGVERLVGAGDERPDGDGNAFGTKGAAEGFGGDRRPGMPDGAEER